MTLEEQLKTAILARYKSVRAFTLANGIPYSTMDSIMKRGIMNAGVGTMLKIFDALDLDIESIADGEIKSKENLLVVTQCSAEAAQIAAAYDRADGKSRRMARLALEDFMESAEPPKSEPPPEPLTREQEAHETAAKIEEEILNAGEKASESGTPPAGAGIA